MKTPYFETPNLFLFLPEKKFADMLLEYEGRNKKFFTPWVAEKDKDFYTFSYQKMILKSELKYIKNGLGLSFYIFLKEDCEKIIGNISVYPIFKGNLSSAMVGYKIDEKYSNKGYMKEALGEVVSFLKNTLKIHRIEAFILKNNIPSIALIKSLGFKLEGENKKYMEINGKWEDHLRFVIINE